MRAIAFGLIAAALAAGQERPLRLAISGLVHGHVTGFLHAAQTRASAVEIVGIADPNAELRRKYAERYGIGAEKLFASTAEMLDRTKPEALAVFTSTFDHAREVEVAAARRVPVMMEKPLATTMAAARRIERAARSGRIPVIVNYETTWYRSHGALWTLFKERKAAGEIRKMVAMDGHQGPREIGVQSEFFEWLTDPVKNGAGALYDFGCYGANLMTWLMDNQRPLAVTALVHTNKPGIYPQVDDEATVLVQYPKAQGIIQGSWNWPFNRKDLEVYGESGQAVAAGGNALRVRIGKAREETVEAPPELPPDRRDPVAYLTAVARGRIQPDGLSSLENNLLVTEILEAARESARTGKAVRLSPRSAARPVRR